MGSDEVFCPDCDGAGEVVGFGCPGFNRVVIPCAVCRGIGNISREKLDWITRGEAMRQERIALNMSLREEAKRRGMKPSDLSDMERGITEPLALSRPNPSGGE